VIRQNQVWTPYLKFLNFQHSKGVAVQDFDPANFVILVVDDEVAVRALIANVLRKEGYQVLDASNGQHALEILKVHAGPVHLLLTDFVMPGMNGIELATAVRNERQGTTVLVISGYTSSQSPQKRRKWISCKNR